METLSRDYVLDEFAFNYSTEALDSEIQDEEAQMKELEAVSASIQKQYVELKTNELVTRQDALTLESLVPGVLPERYPPATFTQMPTGTNYKVALEANEKGQRNIIVRFFIAAYGLLIKIGKWIIGLFRGTKDLDKDAIVASAQALTASLVVAEVAERNPLFENVAIRDLVDTAIVKELDQHLTLANVYQYDPTLESKYSIAYGNFISDFSIGLTLGMQHKNVFQLAGAYLDQLEQSGKSGKVLTLQPPALLQAFATAYTKVEERLGSKPNGMRVGDYLGRDIGGVSGVVTKQSPEYLKNRDASFNLLTYLVRTNYTDVANLQASFLVPDNWLKSEYVRKLENMLYRGLTNLYLPKTIDSELEVIVKRLESLKSNSLESVETLTDEEVEWLRANLRAVQSEFTLLSRVIAAMREQQERHVRFMRAIERGQTKIIADIVKVAPKELQPHIRSVISSNKAAHAALVKRLSAHEARNS